MPPKITPFLPTSDIDNLGPDSADGPSTNDKPDQETAHPSAARADRSTDANIARARLPQSKPGPAPSLQDIQSGSAKLKPGQEGDAVRHVQEQLHMKPTGVYDAATQAAVKQFQTDHGLHSNTNEVGKQTLNALDHPQHSPAPTLAAIQNGSAKLQAGQQGPAVAHIQQQLNLKPSGIYDGATQAAVEKFKQSHGLHSNSLEVGSETLRSMEQAHQPQATHYPSLPTANTSQVRPQMSSFGPIPASIHADPIATNRPPVPQHAPPRPAAAQKGAHAETHIVSDTLHKAQETVQGMLPHLPTAHDMKATYDAGAAKVNEFKKQTQDFIDKLPKQPAGPPPPSTLESAQKLLKTGVDYVGDKVKKTSDQMVHTAHDAVNTGEKVVHAGAKTINDTLDSANKKIHDTFLSK